MVHIVAGLAFETQSLLLGGLSKFMLKRIFLATIAFFFTFVMAFTTRECSAFAGFIEAYSMNCVSFTFRTVSVDFFRNIHAKSLPASQ